MKKQLTLLLVLVVSSGIAPAVAGESGTTTIHGEMFTDFSWLDQQQDGRDTAASGYGLDVKRFYFGADHVFDDTWSVNVTADFDYQRNDHETQVYIKKAYVQAKLDQATVFRAGSAAMPWIPFVEHIYGYRYVEETLVDRLNFGNSYDWGLHLGGATRSGTFSYQAALINGGGYKNPSRSNGMDAAARIAVEPAPGLTFAIGAYNGHLGKDLADAPAGRTATRYDALAAYVKPTFRIGAGWFRADNWNNVITPTSDSADGYSLFGSVAVANNVHLFGRYDHAGLSNRLDPALTDEYYNIGVSFKVRDNIDLALAYKHEDRGDGHRNLRTAEVGVWGRIRF